MTERATKTKTGSPEVFAPFQALPLYKSQGLFYSKLGMYESAIQCYSKARELNAEDEAALIEKSKVEVLIGKHKKALDDALAALGINKQNLNASYMMSVSLFMKGEIEKALMHFHKGLALRKCPPIFDEGVLGTTETDEICIGRNAGPVLLQFLDVIKKLEEKRKKAKLEALKAFSYKSKDKRILTKDLPSETSHSEVEDWWTLKKLESIMSSRYLGRMSQDFYFLRHLEKDPRLITGHKKHSKQLINIAKEALKMVNHTKDILRVRKPFYAVKRMEATTAENLRERRRMMLMKKLMETRSEAVHMVEKLKQERESGNIKKYTENAMKLKDFLNQTPIKLLPNKDIYLDKVYSLTGLAYLDQNKLDPSIQRSDAIEMIEQYYGITPSKKSQVLIDYRQLLAKCEADLEIARSPLEKIWLYYEITKASLELGLKSELTRNASKKCLREAQSLKNEVWIINALVMASKIEMKSQNRAEAKTFIKDAMEYAKKLDMPGVQDYLDLATEVVDLRATEDMADMIGVRQKRIMSIMADSSLKLAAEGLFNYMDNMPVARRMSIVPGVKKSQMLMKRRLSHKSLTPVPSTQKLRVVAFQRDD